MDDEVESEEAVGGRTRTVGEWAGVDWIGESRDNMTDMICVSVGVGMVCIVQ